MAMPTGLLSNVDQGDTGEHPPILADRSGGTPPGAPGREFAVGFGDAAASMYRIRYRASPRSSRTRIGRQLLGAVSLALLLAATAEAAGSFVATVVHVVDGDTIKVSVKGRIETVRYIGMNAPETRHPTKGAEPGGREATEANRRLVLGKTVRLELDVQERDRYGRWLAYVYVGGVMVNAELVRLGYAQVMTIPPNVAHQERLLELQREARARRRGLWASG
jgi:endonuclease YncB( thermonuclease family)